MKIYLNKSRKKDEKVSRYWIKYYLCSYLCTFQPKIEKRKESARENFLCSGRMKLSNSNIKKFVIFLETKTLKKKQK